MSSKDFGPRIKAHVIFCSGEDELFPASSICIHSLQSPGWQTPKLCEYPQTIIFRLEGLVELHHVRVLAHESKIPSKIEMFVADITAEQEAAQTFPTIENAAFRRLGYMAFSNNESSRFGSRELKTVNLKNKAVLVKFNIMRCHLNEINQFNQAGIVAVDFHGVVITPLNPPPEEADTVAKLMEDGDNVPIHQLVPQKKLDVSPQQQPDPAAPQQTAPAANDAESEQYDQITAKRIKDLTLHKARAVSEEDYDLAKALKEQIDILKSVGVQIAELEKRKKDAVDAEDYDLAKALKKQIEDLRNTASRRHPPVSNPNQRSCDPGPEEAPLPPPRNEPPAPSQPATTQPQETAPEAAPEAKPPPPTETAEAPPKPKPAPKPRAAPMPANYDDRPAVAATPANLDEMITRGDTGGIVATAKPQPKGKPAVVASEAMQPWEKKFNDVIVKLSGDQAPAEAMAAPKLTEFKEYVSTCGAYCCACLFCKRWQLREAALRAIVSKEGFAALTDSVRPPSQSNANAVINCLLMYLGAKGFGVEDPISNVYFAVCDTLKSIICEELPGSSLQQVAGPLFNTLPALMLKAGDSNQRVREHSDTVLMLIAMSALGSERVAAAALAEPESGSKKPMNPRVHVARITVTQLLLEKCGLNRKDVRTGLSAEAIVTKLVLPCLSHSSQEVRDGAINLIVALHKTTPAAIIEKFLSDIKPAQKQLIMDRLQEEGGGAAAPKEVEMHSSSFSVERGANHPVLEAAREAAKPPAKKTTGKAAPAPGQDAPAANKNAQHRAVVQDESKTCQFCGKYDERFNDHLLDLHYVRTCPMLVPCPLCGQITEIALLQEHLVKECDRRALVRQCPICYEAVRAEDYDAHVAAKACIPFSQEYAVCPLCHMKLPPGDEGWESHFLQSPGCRNNPRRWDGGAGEEFQ